MSAAAPDFRPPVTAAPVENIQLAVEDETMTAEEVKLQQISQLY